MKINNYNYVESSYLTSTEIYVCVYIYIHTNIFNNMKNKLLKLLEEKSLEKDVHVEKSWILSHIFGVDHKDLYISLHTQKKSKMSWFSLISYFITNERLT